MDNTVTQTTVTKENISSVPTSQTTVTRESMVAKPASGNVAINKINQIIWFIVALIELIIVARLVLLFLGAHNTNFVAWIYSFSNIFILPFTNIFASPTYGTSYLDTASIVGLIAWGILGFILTSLIQLFWKEK